MVMVKIGDSRRTFHLTSGYVGEHRCHLVLSLVVTNVGWCLVVSTMGLVGALVSGGRWRIAGETTWVGEVGAMLLFGW